MQTTVLVELRCTTRFSFTLSKASQKLKKILWFCSFLFDEGILSSSDKTCRRCSIYTKAAMVYELAVASLYSQLNSLVNKLLPLFPSWFRWK